MKQKTKSNFISCLCYSAILGIAAAVLPAIAADSIPVDVFEMDGNTHLQAPINRDWENPGAITFSGILTDTTDRTFKKGSKDTQDVSQWNWDFFNTVTPKDDIQHAYAAHVKDGDDFLIFGMDRLAGSSGGGTTSFGFWAFQDAVALEDPTRATSDTFLGEHKQGDILITGDIGGNTIQGLRVYIWAGGDGLAGHLEEITGLATIVPDCSDSLNGAGTLYETDACGEINTSSITPSWTGGPIEAGRFLEVVLNYTDLVGPLPCFNTFMSTTRTSNSEKSSIKNFLLGSFPVCSIDVAKTCATVDLVDPFAIGGPTYRTEFLATVENDGGAEFSSAAVVTVTDAGADQAFDTADDIVVVRNVSELTTPGDGSNGFQSGEFLDVPESGLTITGFYISTDNGGMNKVKASIVDGPLSVNSGIHIEQCTGLDLSPALYIEKDCDNIMLTTEDLSENPLSQVGITVDYDIRACNTGEYALDVDLSDPTAGVSANGIILAKGLRCDTVPLGFAECPANTHCVGYDNAAPEVPGVCVNDGSLEQGPNGQGGSVNVCTQTDGTYLLTGLAGGATSATPYDAIFSNTATVSASEADNPVMDTTGNDDSIMESDTAGCPLCDEDDDHIPDYLDADSGP